MIAVIFLWFELGAAVIAGLVVIALMIPLNFWLSLKMKQLQVGVHETAPSKQHQQFSASPNAIQR
jgi:hypothetical protein